MSATDAIGGRKTLKYAWYYMVVAVLGYAIAAFLGIAGVLASQTRSGRIAFLAVACFFALIATYLMFSWRNSVVTYDDIGITAEDALRRPKHLLWSDVTDAKYNALQGLLRLKGNGKTISVSYVRVGFREFSEDLKRKLNPSLVAGLEKSNLSRRPAFMGVNTNPITESVKAVEEKEAAAQLLVGLALFQFILALGFFAFAYISRANAALEQGTLSFSLMFLFSSASYLIAGSILFKTSSRVFGAIVTLYALLNLVYAVGGGASFGALLIYFLILWSCGRATYAIILIHQKWPEMLKARRSYPKWFFYLYGLVGMCVVSVAAIFIFSHVYLSP